MDGWNNIFKLPIEDTHWNVSIYNESSDEDSDDTTIEKTRHVYLQVIDKNGYTVGSCTKVTPGTIGWETLLELLGRCMSKPLTWIPRRPKTIQLLGIDTQSSELAFHLSELGIFMPSHSSKKVHNLDIVWRSCSACSRRGSSGMFFLCPGCEAMFYCCKACHEKDLNHQELCSRVKEFMALYEQLAVLPFEFCQLTTQLDFNDNRYKHFLQSMGILGYGYWRREVIESTVFPPFGCLPVQSFPYGLPEEECILEDPPSCLPPSSMSNWESYYSWRGFSSRSPIAILLHFPLTIYYILKTFLSDKIGKDSLCVHIVGAEKEADMFPVFFELAHLLPHIQVELHFVGPLLSKRIDNKMVEFGTLHIVSHKGNWNEVELESPDIVIGLNAGLGAYTSWTKTLERLRDQAIPAFFTDYCQLSCHLARKGVEEQGIGTVSEVNINPFRCPIKRFCEEHCMPWYSNGFIFQLEYG